MPSIVTLAMAALPASIAAIQLHGQSLNALLPRQDAFDITVPCGTYPIGDPNPCVTACGAGFLMCAPAGSCFDNAGGDICCSNGDVCPPDHYCSEKGCCRNGSTLEECGAPSVVTIGGVVNTAAPAPESSSSPAGSPAGYEPTTSAVPPPPPPPAYDSTSSSNSTSTSIFPPPYPPTTITNSWSSTHPTPSAYPPTTPDTSSSKPHELSGYPPVVPDTPSPYPPSPNGYPPVTSDSWTPSPPSPSGDPPVHPTEPSPYPPVITDSWSSPSSTPPSQPTIPVYPTNGTNDTAPWYPPPQQTTNGGVKGEVAGWSISGMTLLVLGFFL